MAFLFTAGISASRLQVFQLNDILLGQRTETFKLLPTAGLAVVSFSLMFDDRTLDVVVKSVRERLWWVAHIQYLHKQLRPHAAKTITESLRTQLQVISMQSLPVSVEHSCFCCFHLMCRCNAVAAYHHG